MNAARAGLALAVASLSLAAAAVAAPTAEGMAHWDKAVEAYEAGRFGAALPELDAAAQAFPDSAVVLATRDDVHLRMGHFDAALADLNAAVR